MRKRNCIAEHETWTKRFFNMYSLDVYKLELKRIVKFSVVFTQSVQHDAFFENSRFWRQVWGVGQLAQCCSRITL